MLTAEQEQWVVNFLKPVGGAKFLEPNAGQAQQGRQNGADGADGGGRHGEERGKGAKAGPDQARDGANGQAPDVVEAISPVDVIPVVIDKAKDLTDPRFAHCVIDNQSDQVLLLDPASVKNLPHGEYKKPPPAQVAAKKKEVFEGESKTVLGRTVTGVEGTVRYFVGDKSTTLDLHFNNPFIGTNTADATLAGANKDKFSSDFDAKDGLKGVFTFTLTSAGGGGGTQPQPHTGGAQTSCLVTIANQTQQTLFLRKQDKVSGDYMQNPPTSLAPGASTQFPFIQTPGSNEAELRGLMSWDVGDPKVATWDLMWDNPTGKKNYTAGILKPDNVGLHSLDQIGQGDENVPVTFTLSGGAGPIQPQPGKESSCEVTIVNSTKLTLSLVNEAAEGGSFAPKPPAKIEPGATVKVSLVGTPNSPGATCGGGMTYIGGEKGEVSWNFDWSNPPGDANTCESGVLPANLGFLSEGTIGKGDEKVPVTFKLSGGADPVVPPQAKAGSCEITIVNNTKSALSLTGRQTAAGSFATEPPTKIDAGATAKVSYASAPNSPEAGCVGSLEYSIGDDGAAAWAVDWNNPGGQANTANGLVTPGSSGFKSSASIGPGDEKVPVSFVLSGGGDGPQPPPPVEEEFKPPPKSKQPTLRKGDESPDGWVEYAQERLNDFGAGLQVNGKFDGKMEAAVRKFQADQKCQADGVIGNETWSALRIGPREAVGTDGRKPHTFEEKDAQARFYYEGNRCVFYFRKDDQLAMMVISTGEQSIQDGKVVVKVTKPDGSSKTTSVKIGKDVTPSPDGQGNIYTVRINKFTKVFGYDSPDHVDGTDVDTYLEQSLGGDRWTDKLQIG